MVRSGSFETGVVTRRGDPRWQDRRPIVRGHVRIRRVHVGDIIRGLGDIAAQMIGNGEPGHTAEIRIHATVRGDPVGQGLRLGQFRKDVVAGPERPDEELGLDDLHCFEGGLPIKLHLAKSKSTASI